jgi:hypothetical protein
MEGKKMEERVHSSQEQSWPAAPLPEFRYFGDLRCYLGILSEAYLLP